MSWTVQTYATTHPGEGARVSCGCGRVVSPDMLYDIIGFTPDERAAMGWMADTTHICDSCLAMAERTGAVTLATLYQRQGAPADVLDRVRAYEATL